MAFIDSLILFVSVGRQFNIEITAQTKVFGLWESKTAHGIRFDEECISASDEICWSIDGNLC